MDDSFPLLYIYSHIFRYVENFRRFGVSGVDILAAEVKELEQLGIVNSAHVKRAQIYISQLVRLQKRLDDELGSGLGKGEAYYDLLKEYNSLISQDPPYQPPRNMELWKAIDVFYFLNMKGDFQDTLSMFVVPMAMKRITGLELIDIIKSPDEVCYLLSVALRPLSFNCTQMICRL